MAEDPTQVARHAFWPFISFEKVTPRYERDEVTGMRGLGAPKSRTLCYAAHSDGHIYSKYAHDLALRLEVEYRRPFGGGVLAYRKHRPPKSNLHMAVESFRDIVRRGECDVVGLDVHNFFGSLVHERLKQSWCTLLCSGKLLPVDHYAVFRSVARHGYLTREGMRISLGRVLPRRRSGLQSKICELKEFREVLAPTVKLNETGAGIPQGASISAVLANLYMLVLDEQLYGQLCVDGVSYRRYSDDILLVCPPGGGAAAQARVESALASIGLTCSPKKTMRIAFRAGGGEQVALRCNQAWQAELSRPLALQYLGMTFDGRAMRLRSTTIAAYIGRMVRAVRSAKRAAERRRMKRLYRRKLYRRFSHLGRSNRIFGPLKIGERRSQNFAQYAKLAARVSASRPVRRQLGKLWVRLEREIAKAEAELAR